MGRVRESLIMIEKTDTFSLMRHIYKKFLCNWFSMTGPHDQKYLFA